MKSFIKLFSFKGRETASSAAGLLVGYFLFFCFLWVLTLLQGGPRVELSERILSGLWSGRAILFSWLMVLLVYLCLTLAVRRLRDAGRSVYWALLMLPAFLPFKVGVSLPLTVFPALFQTKLSQILLALAENVLLLPSLVLVVFLLALGSKPGAEPSAEPDGKNFNSNRVITGVVVVLLCIFGGFVLIFGILNIWARYH